MTVSMIATIVAAVIAAFLLLRLYMVLGRRTGSEGGQPDPMSTNIASNPMNAPKPVVAAPPRTLAPRDEIIDDTEPMSLERQIALVQKVEPEFNERQFLQGARSAFSQIVKAFNDGNETALKPVISPKLFDSFCQAMRENSSKNDQNMTREHTEIRSFDQVEIISARLDLPQSDLNSANKLGVAPDSPAKKSYKLSRLGQSWFGKKTKDQSVSPSQNELVANSNQTRPRIVITVRFTTSQLKSHRNDMGQINKGNGEKPIEMVDVWVFARQALSPDPNWLLVGTRGE
ncbi:MAG: Tim44/TimA family putative adaptor protein [Alphaproteobacteria bacterium]|nr:Tim44/TimA family putative adaptor protein [Alphaproteobacteria bacterium]